MLLHLFIGSILPYIEGLDSWLFEGTLDDPYEEVNVIGNLVFHVPKVCGSLFICYKFFYTFLHPASACDASSPSFIV